MLYPFIDEMALKLKVSFHPESRLIVPGPEVTSLDVQVDVYSASKKWINTYGYNKFRPPMKVVGGNILPDGSPLGRTYLLSNGWRIYLDHGITVTGNLYSENFVSPFLVAGGTQLAGYKFSNLVDVATSTQNVVTGDLSSLVVPTANANASALLDLVNGIETNVTLRHAMRLVLAALAGQLSGAGSETVHIRDVNNTKDRITATVDLNGNRTAVTVDAN